AGQKPDQERASPAGHDADCPPEQTEDDGLDEELTEDVAGPRPHGHAQADLAIALRHGYQHDVHDPDPADNQRDQGHAEKQASDEPHGPLYGADDLGEVLDREIARLVGRDSVTLAKHTSNLIHRGGDFFGRERADEDRINVREPL